MTLASTYALLAALVIGGTIASLKDEDSDVNVMTLGNVYIDQIEQEWNNDESALQGFTQTKPLYPYVGELEWENTDDNGIYRRLTANNVVDKYVTVKNIGKSDAYVRTFIALEMGSLSVEEMNTYVGTVINEVEGEFSGNHWLWYDDYVAEIDGHNYLIKCAVYDIALVPNATTVPSLLQVYLDKTADNKVCEDIDGNGNGTYDILVKSQAVQTEGFESLFALYDDNTALNAAYALESAFGYPANPDTPWDEVVIPVVVNDKDDLVEALTNGETVVLSEDITLKGTVNLENASQINLNGHTLTVSALEAKTDTVISNGTINSGEATYPQVSVSEGTLVLNDVDIICEEPCNVITSGSAQAAEYAGIEVWSGKCILNNSNITVRSLVKRYSNSVFAVGIHGGEFTMNGGTITVENAGSTKEKYNYEGAIFAGSTPDKVVNLNNVQYQLGDKAYKLFAWGGHATINTTDAQGTWDKIDARNGGTYTVNYIK